MTVQDLITELLKLDPQMKVVVNGRYEWNRHNYVESKGIEIFKATLDDNIFYEDEDGTMKILKIQS